ncbi:ankyrin repeat domain-containing protein [Neorickettsia sennetsu]|uniref:Ankyrin repeat protein n=1 Tax=Ehrlichia sennetsu (strain ATCC VR-367 / Miyayama) TaxID=222891 RepID=Q2GDR6_EHRS3|nr:ankyrin repeat domain-containing protein [Neorickettsia sennetsu]ABD46277.1 ankyrin repeat protein [Neorickettsia sennetsu str. Miyayama]
MQGLYNKLLDAISCGNYSLFSQLTKRVDFDYSGSPYNGVSAFNAVVSAICIETPKDERDIADLLPVQTKESSTAIAGLRARITGREEIFADLCKHLRVNSLINLADFGTGLTPVQVALAANNTTLINRLFANGALRSARCEIDRVSGCTLFMKALSCASGTASVEMLKAVARGTANIRQLTTTGKTDRQIVNDLCNYFRSLASNYEEALAVLMSSDGDGKNLYHRALEKNDPEALQWLNKLFLSEKPIIEEAEELLNNLSLSSKYKTQILQSVRYSNDKFTRIRKAIGAADVIFNMPCGELTPTEFIVSNIPSQDAGEFARNAMIGNSDGSGYMSLAEIVDGGTDPADLIKLADAMVRCAPENVCARFFAGHSGSVLLKKLCDFYEKRDGSINEKAFIDFLIKIAFPSCLEFVTEGRINVEDILHGVVETRDPNRIAGIAALASPKSWEHENKAGCNPLELAIANEDPDCFAAILQSLEGALVAASTQEELSAHRECIDRLLAGVGKTSGKAALHFVVDKAPQLIGMILNLSSDGEALLRVKDARGLLPVHHNANINAFYQPLYEKKFCKPITEATANQINDLKESVVLHKKIADGDKSVLQTLFLQDESNVYKCIDTAEGTKSILEVAAESGRPDLVKFILLEHKKLQEKSKNKCKDVEAELEQLTAFQTPEVQEKIGDLEAERTLQEGMQRARSDAMCRHANETLLRVLSTQNPQDWHQEVMDAADLREETLVATLLDSGANPLVTAVQSGNNPVAQKILSEAKECANDDLKDSLIKNQDVTGLLKCGFGSSSLYDATYTPLRDPGKDKAEFEPSVAAVALIREEMNTLRKQVTSKFSGKGVLLTYAHAISMDTPEAENIKDKLNGFEDGDKGLLSVCSPDGHNIGTLIAAFGGIAQWQAYANKYSKLKSADSGGVSPAVNVSADIGTPLQVALLAKHFANNGPEKRRRSLLLDYLLQHHLDDVFIPNVNGENLLHTAVKCSDMEVLDLMLTHAIYTSTTTFSALNQRNGAGRTVLELAVYMDNASALKIIVESVLARHGAGAASALLLESRLLHTAVATNNDAMLKLIASVQKMLNVITAPDQQLLLENQKDQQGRDPFVLAVEMGNLSAMKTMHRAGLQMNAESVKEAIAGLPASFDKGKLDGLIKLLKLDRAESAALLAEREKRLRKTLPPTPPLAVEPQSSEVRGEFIDQVRCIAESESELFKRQSFHAHNSLFSQFQQEYNKRATSLKEDITNDRIDIALANMRLHPDLVDSADNRGEIIEAVLASNNLELAKVVVQSSNKFIKNSSGDNLLNCIIKHASDGSLKELVAECINTGYSLAEVSRDGISAFQLLEERDPAFAAELRSAHEKESAKITSLMNCLEDVLQSANTGAKSRASSVLLGEMNSFPKGYNFPVFSQIFSQILSDNTHGEHSLVTKRLGLLCYLFKGVSYFGEKSPENGDTVLHMLFKVLKSNPGAIVEVREALEAIIANKNFYPELLLEKNYYGFSALDVLAGVKGSWHLLDVIRRTFPNFDDKISLAKMLMFSVLEADLDETREFLERHQGSLLDINSEDNDGVSSLECAILRNDVPMCKLLLEYGAEINTVDLHGRNFLDKILDRSFETGVQPSPEMVSLLVSRGVDLMHSSGDLTTLERFEKFEQKKDVLRTRLAVLMDKPNLCQSDYTELRILMNAQLHQDYCRILRDAVLERERLNEEVSKRAANALYVASGFNFVESIRPIVSAPFRLPKDKSSASLIGGVVCIKVDENASIDIDELFSSVKPYGVRCSDLSFNGGRDVVKVERKANGLTNYIPKSGCVIVSVDAKVKGNSEKVEIFISSDGSVSFGSKKNSAKLTSLFKEGKIDFTSSGVYVDGTPLEKAFGSAPKKAVVHEQLQGVARSLREAGASGAENVHASHRHVPTGGASRVTERGGDIT